MKSRCLKVFQNTRQISCKSAIWYQSSISCNNHNGIIIDMLSQPIADVEYGFCNLFVCCLCPSFSKLTEKRMNGYSWNRGKLDLMHVMIGNFLWGSGHNSDSDFSSIFIEQDCFTLLKLCAAGIYYHYCRWILTNDLLWCFGDTTMVIINDKWILPWPAVKLLSRKSTVSHQLHTFRLTKHAQMACLDWLPLDSLKTNPKSILKIKV